MNRTLNRDALNQCDGCQRGLFIVDGKHYETGAGGESHPIGVMICTKDRYMMPTPHPDVLALARRVIARSRAVYTKQIACALVDAAEHIEKLESDIELAKETLRELSMRNRHSGDGPHCTCDQINRDTLIGGVLRELERLRK